MGIIAWTYNRYRAKKLTEVECALAEIGRDYGDPAAEIRKLNQERIEWMDKAFNAEFLTQKDSLEFIKALLNPPEPTQDAIKAVARYEKSKA